MAMEQADYKEEYLDVLQGHRDNFWYRHRNIVVTKCLKSLFPFFNGVQVLELGAGPGIISAHLAGSGFTVDASDMYSSAISLFSPRIRSAFLFDIINDDVPVDKMGAYDLVILGDVIEHLDDPLLALKKARLFLKSGGLVLITVPAIKQFMSEVERSYGHKRRYDKAMLNEDLVRGGFTVEICKYFMLFPAVALFFSRKLVSILKPDADPYKKELKPLPPLIDQVMGFLVGVEGVLWPNAGTPFGSSLLAVGRKVGG